MNNSLGIFFKRLIVIDFTYHLTMEILGVCIFRRNENTLIANIIGALSSIIHVGWKVEAA